MSSPKVTDAIDQESFLQFQFPMFRQRRDFFVRFRARAPKVWLQEIGGDEHDAPRGQLEGRRHEVRLLRLVQQRGEPQIDIF